MTNITKVAYVALPIHNNQAEYSFPFWTQQDAHAKNTDIVVQILNGSNLRTLIEGKEYEVRVNAAQTTVTIDFGKNGLTFIPSTGDGEYIIVNSAIPFIQAVDINTPPTKKQLQNIFDNQQQQINQLKACCDRAIHTQFDPKISGYPVISVATKDFKPGVLLMLDHTGTVVVSAGFGKDEIDELKKQAALVAKNIQTIANFAAAAGSSATLATTEAAKAAQSALDAAAQYLKTKTEAEKAIKNVDAKANSAVAKIISTSTNAVNEVKTDAANAILQVTTEKDAATQAITTAKATLIQVRDDALAKLAAALLSITNLTKTSIAEITQKLADVLKLIDPQVKLATDQAKIAVQAATDAQTAESNAKAAAQHVDTVNAALTPINTLFAGTGTKDDIVARNTAGKWAVESGTDHLKSIMLSMLTNGQLLWRDQDAITAIDRTSLGGGGSGGGSGPYDHKVIHLGQDDGTAPVTQQAHQEHYAMLQVPYADKATQAARTGKMPKVDSTGNNWEYIVMPAPDSIVTMTPTPGTTTIPQIDLSKLILPNVSSQYGVVANFDKPTNKWTITATPGGSGMGNGIPNPPADGKNYYVDTKVATNGGIDVNLDLVPLPKPTAQDVGKIAVVDSTHQAFEYIMPIKHTEATKRIMSQTGVVDSPQVMNVSGLSFTMKPFSVAYTDPSTKVMEEHTYTSNVTVTVPQDTTVTVYIDPTNWTIEQLSGEPTEALRQSNVLLCVVYTKSNIQHIKWAYDPISHQERVLGEIARGLGAFGKGIFLKIDATGLKSQTDGYIYDFVGRGQFSRHKIGDISTFYKMTNGLIDPTTTNVLLQKVYYDKGTTQEVALDSTHKFVIHNIVTGASLTGSPATVLTKAIIVIGHRTFATAPEAKRYLAEAREDIQIASLISMNMVLIAQIIVPHNGSTNTDIQIFNYAGIRSSTSAITRASSLPQGTQSDDNSVLKYVGGKYVLNKSIIPVTIDPNITPGQVIVSEGANKVKGVDAATLNMGIVPLSTKMININVVLPQNTAIQKDHEYIGGAAGVMSHGVHSVKFEELPKPAPIGQMYNMILKLDDGFIQDIDDVVGIKLYGVAKIAYSYSAQFFALTSANTITCYTIINPKVLVAVPNIQLKLSATIFYGGG